MSHEEYWDYLDDITLELVNRYPTADRQWKLLYLKLTASPYHFWLENRAGQHSITVDVTEHEERYRDNQAALAHSSPKESSENPPAEDSSNLADKAQEIRSFVRANVNDKEHKHMTKSAKNALLVLVQATSKRLLENVPDDALIVWYGNWVEKVKL